MPLTVGQQIFARLYIQEGCPVCKQAIEFLEANRIATDCIPIDPISNIGVAILSMRRKGIPIDDKNLDAIIKFGEVPYLVSFLTKKVVYGFNVTEYQRLAAAVAAARAPAPNNAAPARDNSGEAPPVGAQMATDGQAA